MSGGGQQRGAAVRVLVADDNDDLRELVCEGLMAHGLEVLSAGTGDRAIAVALAEAPDVLVLDLRMPGLDGAEIIRELRRQRGDVSAILISAAGDVRETAGALGVPYLTKPFSLDSLLELVAAAVSARRAARGGPA